MNIIERKIPAIRTQFMLIFSLCECCSLLDKIHLLPVFGSRNYWTITFKAINLNHLEIRLLWDYIQMALYCVVSLRVLVFSSSHGWCNRWRLLRMNRNLDICCRIAFLFPSIIEIQLDKMQKVACSVSFALCSTVYVSHEILIIDLTDWMTLYCYCSVSVSI